MNPTVQICSRCVMDQTDPWIQFDAQGICSHCTKALGLLQEFPLNLLPDQKQVAYHELIAQVKQKGKRKKYDCLIGLSGGVDSSYVALKVKEAGLRPLAVHLDNGWNSELSVQNIQNICRKLDIDLFTRVLDWDEFRFLQLAFLKASTPDSEIPTDHAIFATLFELAQKWGIKHVLTGINLNSESIMPRTWSYGHWDWRYISAINRRFGDRKLKDFPHFSLPGLIYHLRLRKTQWTGLLNYMDYDKEAAKKEIISKLDWKDYGGKHHESIYTRFFQSYILPRKFGIDKRKAHLSALICAGQMNREQALEELKKPIMDTRAIEEDRQYVIKKLELSSQEFEAIMQHPPQLFTAYPNNFSLFVRLNRIRNKK